MEIQGFEPGPGVAAVLGLRLHHAERQHAGMIQVVDQFPAYTDHADEFAGGQLHDVGFSVVAGMHPGVDRYAAALGPCPTVVIAVGGDDEAKVQFVSIDNETFAQVNQIAIAQADRSMGGVDGNADVLGPGGAFVVAEHEPGTEVSLGVLIGDGCEGVAPFLDLLSAFHFYECLLHFPIKILATNINAGPTDQQVVAAQVDHADVSIIQRGVVDDAGRGPGGAVIGAGVEDRLAPRTGMRGAQTGAADDQRAVVEAFDGGPAEVAEIFVGQAANDAVLGG